jgi:hypothetical protein
VKKQFPREYSCWKGMRKRCNNPRRPDFKNYGGRGIRVCSRWDSFDAFISDMGPCPPGMTIDRKDNDAGYNPMNCHWASRGDQNKNKRNLIRVEHDGNLVPICVLGEQLGFSRRRIDDRLRKGWTVEEAINTPQRTSPGEGTRIQPSRAMKTPTIPPAPPTK